MNLLLHLRIAGLLLLALAAMHVFLPKRLGWREELVRLSLLNRQIFWVHCLFIIMVVVMFGLLATVYAPELLKPSPLAKVVLAGVTLFWLARLVVQWCVYDRRLWIGNRFNTAAHVLFTLLWGYFVVVFGAAWWQQMRV